MIERAARSAATARIAAAVVIVLAAVPIAVYLRIALASLRFPYPLEWMEGGSLDVVARILAGRPVYTAPTVEYVPYIYTPLYYWVSAGAARLVGLDFFAARLVSFGSICGVAGLIWAFVRHEGGRRIEAVASIGVFTATYPKVLGFFHLARVDSLYLLLLLAGFYVLRTRQSARSAAAAAALLWLAFMTKQIALLTAAIALPVAALGAPRRTLTAAGTFGALVIGTNIVMNARTGGWWGYFVYRLPLLHDVVPASMHDFWRYDIGRVLPVAAVAGALIVVRSIRADRTRATFYAGLLAGVLAAAWITRLYYGSGNVLMPAYAVLAIVLPLGMRDLRREAGARTMTLAALALQLAIVLQAGAPLIGWSDVPGAPARASGDKLVAFLRTVKGEVLIWDQRFVETRAGKVSWGLEAAAEDVLSSYDAGTRDALRNAIVDACRTGRFAGAIDPPEWLQRQAPFGDPEDLDGVWVLPPNARQAPAKFYPLPPADRP